MTEGEWLASEDPGAMLRLLIGGVRPSSDHKLRLFDDACFDMFGLTIDDVGAGQENPPAGIAALLREVVGNPWRRLLVTDAWVMNPEAFGFCGVFDKRWLTPDVLSVARRAYDERPGRECTKCGGTGGTGYGGFGLCPDCGGTGRIEDGALDAATLAVLADALEEAGCVGENCLACGPPRRSPPKWVDILPPYWCGLCDEQTHLLPHPLLAHLRSPGPHVRGCWALDLVLALE